jgi:hypothetical protein
LNRISSFQAAENIRTWIFDNKIEILNVGGPRKSKDTNIYKDVLDILETAFYLDIVDTSMPHMSGPAGHFRENYKLPQLPKTIDQAADTLISGFSFGDRTKIANLSPSKLESLAQAMTDEIVARFSIGEHNPDLMSACRKAAGNDSDDQNVAVKVIMERVWEILRQKRNVLKLVKS